MKIDTTYWNGNSKILREGNLGSFTVITKYPLYGSYFEHEGELVVPAGRVVTLLLRAEYLSACGILCLWFEYNEATIKMTKQSFDIICYPATELGKVIFG